MKGNEIRIGCNFQLENGVLEGGIATIKNKYDLDVAFDLLESNLIKPIPLTEEWLLKFGFEFDEICNNEDFNNRDYKLKINCDEEIYICLCMNIWQIGSDVNMCYTRNREILYVHQLQNLYFALTGEEITFKSE